MVCVTEGSIGSFLRADFFLCRRAVGEFYPKEVLSHNYSGRVLASFY